MDYPEFLKSKEIAFQESGFSVDLDELNPNLLEFQKHLVRLALTKGRFCLWMSTGLGKTLMQLSWAEKIAEKTNGKVLVLAPLVVAQQTEREGKKFGIECKYVRDGSLVGDRGIYVTNYDMLDKFDNVHFDGVVIDESSVLKHFASKTRHAIINRFVTCQYKLACSATPAPNDYIEIGNHCEFMGVMGYTEMLAMFFTHDGGDTSKWRIKGHARKKFWNWVSGWAAMANHPRDLGFEDDRYDLPKLHQHSLVLDSHVDPERGELLRVSARSLNEHRQLQRQLIDEKCMAAASLVNASGEQWIVWCHLNSESGKLAKLIDDSVEVKGSDSIDRKEKAVLDFIDGKVRVIISKTSIMGFGLNAQNCHNMVFVGLSHSFESVFQSVRRVWRFGQKEEVHCYFIYHHLEGNIVENLNRKESEFKDMQKYLIPASRRAIEKFSGAVKQDKAEYNPQYIMELPTWM